ncbi:9292_t:CDS:2 [Entrophospora sp. SA101]|nr:9292_t:CDS:2 [Entrophospora sp. SA101]
MHVGLIHSIAALIILAIDHSTGLCEFTPKVFAGRLVLNLAFTTPPLP